MRKLTLLSLLFVGLFYFATVSLAQEQNNSISVYLNGEQLHFSSSPIIKNNTTLVPFREIFESLEMSVAWDGENKIIHGNKLGLSIKLQIGSNTATVNDSQITLQSPPEIINEKTYVPLRFITESTGNEVLWDGLNKRIDINISQTSNERKELTTEEIGKLGNRVVFIEVFDSQDFSISTGSGVIISSNGKIVTNHHVIDGGNYVVVELNDQVKYKTSEILQLDKSLDLAVIKIDAKDLPYFNIGDSSQLQLGESVVTISSPLGYRNSLTTGVVSSTSRELDNREYIQISNPVDKGSSGGALINKYGELVGIIRSRIVSNASINLAIPSNVTQGFLNRPINRIFMDDIFIKTIEDLNRYLNQFSYWKPDDIEYSLRYDVYGDSDTVHAEIIFDKIYWENQVSLNDIISLKSLMVWFSKEVTSNFLTDNVITSVVQIEGERRVRIGFSTFNRYIKKVDYAIMPDAKVPYYNWQMVD